MQESLELNFNLNQTEHNIMKLSTLIAILAAALLLASCVTSETTVTAPDGTVTRTKQTVISGQDIATGAAGAADAVKVVRGDK
jgi:PBP1b-binding outer membrane lipoprotein LpoB